MPRRELTLLAGALLLLALPLLAWWWGGLTQAGLPIALSLTLLVFMAGVAYHDYQAGCFDLFQPILFKGLLFFLPSFVLKAWYIIFFDPDVRLVQKMTAPASAINWSLATGVLAYCCLIVGYYWCPGQQTWRNLFPATKRLRFQPFGLLWAAVILYLIGIAMSLYLLQSGYIGFTDLQETRTFINEMQYISKFNLFSLFILIFGFVCFRTIVGLSWKIILTTIFLCQIILGLWIGSRGYLFLNGIVILTALQYSGYLQNNIKKMILPLCLIVCLLIIGVTFVSAFRIVKIKTIGYGQPADFHELMDVSKGVVDFLQEMGLNHLPSWLWERVTERTNNLESLAIVLERAGHVQELERAYGMDNNLVHEFLWGLVPRFIYPEKPIMSDAGVLFGYIYFDVPTHMRVWCSPTIMGDLYRNGGFLAIMLGMIILGMFLRIIYSAFVTGNRNPLFFVTYLFSIIGMNFEGTYMGIYHGAVRLWIMTLIYLFIFILLANMVGPKFYPLAFDGKAHIRRFPNSC